MKNCSDPGSGLMTHYAPRTSMRVSRFYGAGLGQGGCVAMSFDQFVAASRDNEQQESPPWRFYMQEGMVWGAGGYPKSAAGQLCHPAVHSAAFRDTPLRHAAHAGPTVAADLDERIDWSWLAAQCETAHTSGFHSCTMWAGCGGGCTPCHNDGMSNFFAQRSSIRLAPDGAAC